MSALANGFVLGTLSILASGYIVYDAPICRFWWSRSSGYVLYFRIIVTGLLLVSILSVLLNVPVFRSFTLFDFQFGIEYAPILAFAVALVLRFCAALFILCGSKIYPPWKHRLNLKNLNDKGLDQFIYERMHAQKMIMVTLENSKVYMGWPMEAANNEDSKWLRLVPQWSGYRNNESTINIQIDYAKVRFLRLVIGYSTPRAR